MTNREHMGHGGDSGQQEHGGRGEHGDHGEHGGHDQHDGHAGHADNAKQSAHGHRGKHDGHGEHRGHSGHHDHQQHHRMMMADFRQRFFVSTALSIPVLVLSPLIQGFLGYTLDFAGRSYAVFGLATLILVYGGKPFYAGLIRELKDRSPGMMTLIALAISVAYVYSSAVVFGLRGQVFFWELATLIDIMLLGHWIEMRSVMSASGALEELAKLMPDTAHLKEDHQTSEVKISELNTNDVVLVKPGEKIPADGIIVEGSSAVDESMLTGESEPVKKTTDQQVIGGSVNGQGLLEVRVTGTGEDSYVSQMIRMVREAQEAKSKTQTLADRAALVLTIIALTTGTATLIAWILIGQSLAFSVERMATVMVITCPHALGLAIPLVVAVSTALSARNGLLIRNRTAFENARKLTTVVFDKTGTLTRGKFGVSEIKVLSESLSEEDLVRLAGSVEQNSEHPIARGIVEKAGEMEIELQEASDFEAMKGRGVRAKVDGKMVLVVGPGYLKEHEITVAEKDLPDEPGTTVFVLTGDQVGGLIHLSDTIRPQSQEAVDRLKKDGIKCWMLTGDNEATAKHVAGQLGLDGYFAEVLPDEKQDKIKELQGRGEFVAMTGDGVNDAPALAQADIGIAIGSGTDVAAATADIVLVNDDPADVTALILFGRATYKKMVQNLIWATGYNAVAIPLAAGVLFSYGITISPAMGAVLMSMSTVIVAINARLLRVGKGE